MSNHEKKVKANHLEIEMACMKDYEDLTEKDLRIQLAASYRLVEELGWSFLIFGHLTARVPGREKHFLINPYGLMYDEINASNLVKIDLKGKKVEDTEWDVNPAGFIIHSAVHSSKSNAHCVMHTHTNAGMAMAALKKGLINIDFSGSAFHKKVAYHDFEGVTLRKDECKRIADDLGDKSVMILKNHGLLTTGLTVAEAFMKLYTLESACKVQLMARACGEEYEFVPAEVAESHSRDLKDAASYKLAFRALVRRLLRKDPSFIL
jgi:ribulose-5-phosphate 4-epimerase/fuculose-1-phosphate aldolase